MKTGTWMVIGACGIIAGILACSFVGLVALLASGFHFALAPIITGAICGIAGALLANVFAWKVIDPRWFKEAGNKQS